MEPSRYCHIVNENNDMEIIEQPYADAIAENINEDANESSFDIYDEDNSIEYLEQTLSDTSSESMDESDRESTPEEHIDVVAEPPENLSDSDSEITYYNTFYDGEGGSVVWLQARHIDSDESDRVPRCRALAQDNGVIAEPPENLYDGRRRGSYYNTFYDGEGGSVVWPQARHIDSDESDRVLRCRALAHDNGVIAEPPENLYDGRRRGSFYSAFYGFEENNVDLQQERNYTEESVSVSGTFLYDDADEDSDVELIC